ncbi:MAG TPA: nucleoside monophosphate kinase [Candidatus Saccharimonadales bacterium]
MIIVLIGPPGAGKSSQSELLRQREHVNWLYVGKLLRSQNDKGLDDIINSGQLVPDNIVNRLVASYIKGIPAKQLVVIDGFPRHLPQAEWLVDFSRQSQLPISGVIYLMVPAEVTKQRLGLRQREDDTPGVIDERLKEYERDMAPVVSYFESRGVPVHPVDGNRPIEVVFKDIDRILNDVHATQI